MNVIVVNEQQNQLANIDIDIIKSINGVFDASELVEMFKNFFYSKMILDVTALNLNNNIHTYETLVSGLDPNKIIFVLPEGSSLCTPNFLSRLISLGIYNFTTDINGIKYLVKKTNTLSDVENIIKMADLGEDNNPRKTSVKEENISAPVEVAPKGGTNTTIIGVKNVTNSAGATTFVYMLKKELVMTYGSDNIMAIEINKNDFPLFNDKNMISIGDSNVQSDLKKYDGKNIILIDLNNAKDTSFCDEVIYLLEPSTIKLNKLVKENRIMFGKLVNKKVILNKSLLLNSDVSEFEKEAGFKVFYNMPPLDDRKRNEVINDFLQHLGLLNNPKGDGNDSNKIFGLFRR